MDARLVLEDGTVFTGRSVGAAGIAAGEACFTTASAGYEQAVTDPSYARQVLTFASPLVGNYGVDEALLESSRVWTEGVVMRRARPEWADWLAQRGVVALEEVDTRALVRRLREDGAMRCALGTAAAEELHAHALAHPHLDWPRMLAEPELASPHPRSTPASPSRSRSARARASSCSTSAASARSCAGSSSRASRRSSFPAPGTPRPCSSSTPPWCWSATAPATRRSSTARSRPCASCSGRSRSSGSASATSSSGSRSAWRRSSFPFGHRGANHPVRVTGSKRVLVTAQNHGFAVAPGDAAEVSHVSLNDGTVEGLRGDGFETLQFHPEAAPGPHDAVPFFDRIADACRSAPTYAAS